MKYLHLAVLPLLLCSCGGSERKPDAGATAKPPPPNMNQPEVRRRMDEARYARPGRWVPVERPGAYALLDHAKEGDRLVVLRRIAGYDVYQISLGCGLKGAYSIGIGRGADRDDLPPRTKSAPPPYLDLSAQARTLCAAMPTGATMSLGQAVQDLRSRSDTDRRTASSPPPAMTQADRDAAKAAMKAHQARK